MITLLSILAALFSVFGNILIIFKKRIAFAIWGIGNVLWVWESIVDSLNIPLIAMNVIYFGINAAAFYEWRENKDAVLALIKEYSKDASIEVKFILVDLYCDIEELDEEDNK